MKAIRIHAFGGPEVLQEEEAPRPELRPGDVLVRVKAAGINPIDWKVRQGYLREHIPHRLPLILGWDVAGVVESVHAGVTRFSPGDEVYARPDITRDGAYAEYVAMAAKEAARKPARASFEEAAAAPLAALTAWAALRDEAGLEAGMRVLIHAGAGGVGAFAVQIAKDLGARVFSTASSANQGLLRELGVDEAIDYTAEDFASRANEMDVVLDTVGGDVQLRSWQCLRPGGTLVSAVSPPAPELALRHGARARLVRVMPDGQRLEQVASMIDEGRLRVVLDRVFDLSDVAEAHQHSQSGRARGKIVLKVG